MGVAHGDEAVVVLVFVVAFDYKAVLHTFPTVNQRPLRDNRYRKTIDLADTLVVSVRVGTLCQPLKMYAHILLIGKIAGVNLQVVQRIPVLVTLDNRIVPCPVRLHTFKCSLVVGYVVGNGLVTELRVSDTLAVCLALTFQRRYTFFKFSLIKQISVTGENSHILREVHAVLLIHSTLINGTRSQSTGFELVNKCSLAVEKVELVGVQ